MFPLEPPENDGLYMRKVGSWTTDKHHFLRRYIDAFTTAMKDKPWSGLHYVDLFAGAGIEQIRNDGLEWGSPLIAAQSPHRFSRIHLCDMDKKCCDALQQRLQKFQQPTEPQIILGDANEAIDEIIQEIPPKSLTLAFIDPTGLHFQYKTLIKLSQRRADLIIFFPDYIDALRNMEKVYREQSDSNLDKVLGTSIWREQIQCVPWEKRIDVVTKLYLKQINLLGYNHYESERIDRNDGRFLYLLIYCTQSQTGLKIWRNIASQKPGGQRSFGF